MTLHLGFARYNVIAVAQMQKAMCSMIRILDHLSPTSLTRRQWLQLGSLGALGLSMPTLLRADAAAKKSAPIKSCGI